MFISFLKKAIRYTVVFSVMSLALVAGTSTSEAAKCGNRELIVKQLNSKFSETLRSRGLISDKLLMELFASKRGSWSILFTSPKGHTCVIATGRMWLDNITKKKLPEA